jgi:hypothetical protein
MTNGFQGARAIEAKGMAVLEPFLMEKSDGRLVLLEKGPLARVLQESLGDGILQAGAGGRSWSVEIKVEQTDSPNLFLETWSNRNLESRESHIERGSTPGWMLKLRADLLLYYFLDSDRLYVFDLFRLQRWAFGHKASARDGQIYRFPEKLQGRWQQLNDTWGRCVPLTVLRDEVGYRLVNPRQLPLFPEEDAA